jgi:hypothetical protein
MKAKVTLKQKFYENQVEAANKVMAGIKDDKVVSLVLATTQSGKTGTMACVAEQWMKHYNKKVYVITGLSSIDWKIQTKQRFSEDVLVLHRNDLKKKTLDLSHALVLVDEVQLACKVNMSIDLLLFNNGAKDFDFLVENKTRIVMVSATPNGVLEDLFKWSRQKVNVVVQNNGPLYTGLSDLLEDGRILEAKDLHVISSKVMSEATGAAREMLQDRYDMSLNAIKELKDYLTSWKEPFYHIIRTPYSDGGSDVRLRFVEVFGELFDYKQCDCQTDHEIMKIIQKKPEKATFLFIKEQLRCAITLTPKTHIGVLYDRVSNFDNVMVQGLAGRCTGYDVHDKMVVFTSLKSIKKYVEDVESGFLNLNISYCGKGETFIHPRGFVDEKSTIDSEVESCGPHTTAL